MVYFSNYVLVSTYYFRPFSLFLCSCISFFNVKRNKYCVWLIYMAKHKMQSLDVIVVTILRKTNTGSHLQYIIVELDNGEAYSCHLKLQTHHRKFSTSINILVNKGIDKLSTYINTSKECEVKRFFWKGKFSLFCTASPHLINFCIFLSSAYKSNLFPYLLCIDKNCKYRRNAWRWLKSFSLVCQKDIIVRPYLKVKN